MMGMASCWANFGLRYFLVGIWITINILVFWKTYTFYKHDLQYYYLHQMLGPSLCVSRGTANVLNLNLGLMLLPMCKALTTWLRGHRLAKTCGCIRRLLDHTKGFHILCSCIVGICSVVHYFAHVFNAQRFSQNYNCVYKEVNGAESPHQNPLLLVITSFPGLTGVMMMLIISVIISSSRLALRNSNYEIFWYTHKLHMILYFLLLIHGLGGILKAQGNISMHSPGCHGKHNVTMEMVPFPESEPAFQEPNEIQDGVAFPEESGGIAMECKEGPTFHTIGSSSWKWLLIPLLIYTCDVIWRWVMQTRLVTFITDVIPHPGGVIELRLTANAKFIFKPGQYILVRSPVVHPLESHPYTITKFPTFEDTSFSIHMKVAGDWSELMMNYLSDHETFPTKMKEENSPLTEKIYIEGPFSSPMEDILRYKICLCVAGGIGITPFISISSYILATGDTGSLVRFRLLWVCPNSQKFEAFIKDLQSLHDYLWSINRPDLFEVQFYVTKDPLNNSLVENCFISRRLHKGRPDLTALISEAGLRHTGCTIGVFSCGPKSLHLELENICEKENNTDTKFICSHDSF